MQDLHKCSSDCGPVSFRKAPFTLLGLLFLVAVMGAGQFDDNPFASDVPVILHSVRFECVGPSIAVSFSRPGFQDARHSYVSKAAITDRSPPPYSG